VTAKTGYLFERRLIEKYIDTTGKCPVSGEELSMDDLVSIKASKVVKPRPVQATSIPGMLSLFQNEWDSLMLETYTLKQNLDTVRQELSHSLYQHDAACRVIARLTKERDEARAALASAQADIGATTAAAAGAMDMDHGTGIPPSIVEKMAATSKGLSKSRKKREVSPSTATAEDIAKFSATSSTNVHGASKPGVLCLDISKDSSKALTGGVDGTAVVTDRSSGQIAHTLKGHSKKITDVIFHPTEDLLFTTSADKTARVWNLNGNDYSTALQLKCHSAEVSGAALHATGDYLVTASLDQTWAFWDIHTGSMVMQQTADGSGYTVPQFHPDGLILATGTSDNQIKIWDIKEQKCVHVFKGHEGAVNSVSFSENGYYMASAATDNTVKLWDLRKLKNFATINANDCSAVSFDLSGQFMAAASGKNITVYSAKSWEVVKQFDDAHASQITDIKWGLDARFLASTAMDRALKFFA
jgi:pre-mRNA-processing factor 19